MMSAIVKDVGLQPSLLGDVCVGKSDDSQSEQNIITYTITQKYESQSYMKSNLYSCTYTAVFQVMCYNLVQVHLWLESHIFLGEMSNEFIINRDIPKHMSWL